MAPTNDGRIPRYIRVKERIKLALQEALHDTFDSWATRPSIEYCSALRNSLAKTHLIFAETCSEGDLCCICCKLYNTCSHRGVELTGLPSFMRHIFFTVGNVLKTIGFCV